MNNDVVEATGKHEVRKELPMEYALHAKTLRHVRTTSEEIGNQYAVIDDTTLPHYYGLEHRSDSSQYDE